MKDIKLTLSHKDLSILIGKLDDGGFHPIGVEDLLKKLIELRRKATTNK